MDIGEWILVSAGNDEEDMWIGEVVKKTQKTIYFNWVYHKGGDEWVGGGVMTPKGSKCRFNDVLASFKYEINTLMPKELTDKLTKIWNA